MQKLVESGEMFNDYLSMLDEIQQPSLLLVGEYDPACGQEQRKYFYEHSPNGTTIVFKNSGHFPRIEEPQVYTKAIIDFVLAST